ncbi:MAG: SH3 domain-containing protein [Frankia sp.]
MTTTVLGGDGAWVRRCLGATIGPVRRVVAVVEHEVPARPPLRVTTGEQVCVGERDTRWPAFVFVTTAGGTGWVPARQLSHDAGQAVVRAPYDTTELPLRVGDIVEVVVAEDVESGWLWCRSDGGREGWVPINAVQDVLP